jgi:hypothetical protein
MGLVINTMANKQSRVMSISINNKPYMRRVVRNGRVQRAFAAQIGKKVGLCVQGKMHDGVTKEERNEIFKDCSVPKGTRLAGGFNSPDPITGKYPKAGKK